MRGPFRDSRSLRKWLKERTKQDFALVCDKDNKIFIFIARNNTLLTWTGGGGYMQWFQVTSAQEALNFINQE